jgi:hypothetical protein
VLKELKGLKVQYKVLKEMLGIKVLRELKVLKGQHKVLKV